MSLQSPRGSGARLIALLERHGINWRLPPKIVATVGEPEPSRLSAEEKILLYSMLSRGRTDV